MGIRVASLAAVLGLLSTIATAASAAGPTALRRAASTSPAIRFDGASASFTVSARIIRASASVGPNRRPPAPNMIPRHTTVSAADGRPVPALVYDFE